MKPPAQQKPSVHNSLSKREFSKLTREQSESLSFRLPQQEGPPSPEQPKSLYYSDIPMRKEPPQWGCSSATLRHSSKSFKFPIEQRFPDPRTNYLDAQTLEYPSLLGKRATSQGVGQRVDIPAVFGSNKFTASENCPFYEVDQDSVQRSNSAMILGRGKTFGIGWRHYEPSRAAHRATVHSSYQRQSNPGPNRYVLNPEGQNSAPKMMIHQRLQMWTTRNGTYRRNDPDPQSYEIKEGLVKRQQSAHGFGFGQKTDFTKLREKTPGPIYQEKNICDKFVHLKLKLGLK